MSAVLTPSASVVTDARTEDGPVTPRMWLPRVTGRGVFRAVLVAWVLVIVASYAVPLLFQVQGERLLVVTSGSMAPEIHAGDAVVMRQVTSAAELRIGQIVTFIPVGSDKQITHRIVNLVRVMRRDEAGKVVMDPTGQPVLDPFVKTKGDANQSDDPNLTPASRVRGIVLSTYPGWGFFFGAAHSPLGRLVLFGPPLLLLLGAELLSRAPAEVRDRLRPRLPKRRSGGLPALTSSTDDDDGAAQPPSQERDDDAVLV